MNRASTSDGKLEIRPVTPEIWEDFERLFEDRGGPKSCWCMIWRSYARSAEGSDQDDRKRGMRKRILGAEPVGLLAYLDGEPVAWCSVAPRQSYKASLTTTVENNGKWSLTCMFVKRRLRGRGLSASLIEAAIDHARSQGATTLEAYPVATDSPSYRFCGFLGQFESLGFRKVGTVGSRRNTVTKSL